MTADKASRNIDEMIHEGVKNAAIDYFNISGTRVCGDVFTYVDEDVKRANLITGTATVTIDDMVTCDFMGKVLQVPISSVIEEFEFELEAATFRGGVVGSYASIAKVLNTYTF